MNDFAVQLITIVLGAIAIAIFLVRGIVILYLKRRNAQVEIQNASENAQLNAKKQEDELRIRIQSIMAEHTSEYIDTLKTLIEDQKIEINQNRKRTQGLETQFSQIKLDYQSLNIISRNFEREVTDLRTEIALNKADLTVTQQKLIQAETAVAVLTKRLEDLQQQTMDSRTREQETRQELVRTQEENSQLRKDLDETRKQLFETRERFAICELQLNAAKSQSGGMFTAVSAETGASPKPPEDMVSDEMNEKKEGQKPKNL